MKKTQKIELRVSSEVKELVRILVEHSPQDNISELIEQLILNEACRVSTVDDEVRNALESVLPSKKREEIIEETAKEWRIYELCQK